LGTLANFKEAGRKEDTIIGFVGDYNELIYLLEADYKRDHIHQENVYDLPCPCLHLLVLNLGRSKFFL